MAQARNPFTPERVYIPDGEAHVFDDRVYLYGSHDKEGGKSYCRLGYEVFSAPIDNLSQWTSKGINYQARQDPLSEKTDRPYRYAPDCVKGNDGRYYLYYCLAGEKGKGRYDGPISVAVCPTPDGKFEFYGHVRNKDGSLFLDHILFDPAVINDEGTIRLYYGTYYCFSSLPKIIRPIGRKIESLFIQHSPKQIKAYNDKIRGAYTVTLDNDRLTVSSSPKEVIDCYRKDGPFKTQRTIIPKGDHFRYGHGFFEGSSIRKINGEYYFVYSSRNNHELCYARSKYPDRDFSYGGVIISNGDVGYKGRKEKDRLNYTATNHGCIEEINGKYYVFYHKETHGSDYSRVACAEEIKFDKEGNIPQVERTSCGLNEGVLKGKGVYPAFYATYITNGRMPHRNNTQEKRIPCLTTDKDYAFITRLRKGSVVGYRYFDLSLTKRLVLFARGKGELEVFNGEGRKGKRKICSPSFHPIEIPFSGGDKEEIHFRIRKGKVDILRFELK